MSQPDDVPNLDRKLPFAVGWLVLALSMPALMVVVLVHQPGSDENPSVLASLALFSVVAFYMAFTRLRMRLDDVGITRPPWKPIRWVDVVAASLARNGVLTLATEDSTCDIELLQLKDPERVFAYIKKRLPARSHDKAVPFLWRLTRWR